MASGERQGGGREGGAGANTKNSAPRALTALPPSPHSHSTRRLLAADTALPPHAPSTHSLWGPLADGGSTFVIVLTSAPPSPSVVTSLERTLAACGGHVGSFLPEAAFVAAGLPGCRDAAASLPGVAAVDTVPPSSRVAAALASARPLNATHASLAAVFPRLGRGAGGDSDDSAYAPAVAAAVDWAHVLASAFGGASSTPAGRHVLHITAPSHTLPSLVAWLAGHPAVHWIEPAPRIAPSNWHAAAIIQSGRAAREPLSSRTAVLTDAAHPVWAAGVRGASQVIGGGDSGLDVAHCFFVDPAIPITFKPASSGGGSIFESDTHRKLRLYRAGPDGASDGNGHGTHTMATLVGSPPLDDSSGKSAAYGGMAPDAKLAFTDLSATSASRRFGGGGGDRGGGGIIVPGDIGSDYYKYAYSVGARVHSDSWGSPSTDYDHMAAEVDAFAFKNQDFVPVLAAGNEGAVSASPTRGVTTVTAPATAKNCIAVGASQSAYAHGAGGPGSAFSLHRLTVAQSGGGNGGAAASQDVESFRVVQAQFGGKLASLYGRRLRLAAADPPDACSSLADGAAKAAAGAVLVAARGACAFAAKAGTAQAAGAAALVVYDDRIADFFIPAADGGGGSVTIPAAAVPRRVGQLLASAASADANVTVAFGPASSSSDAWDSLADFSSKGPTKDGRIKPDLVAPGVVQSAASRSVARDAGGGSCPLRTMQGTSMATPVAAGAAALVRDYFVRGFYPSGKKTEGAGFEPGGALVKAVLIAGAAPLDGFEVDTGLPLAPPPSFRQGFGRVHIGRSLPLSGGNGPPSTSLQIVDRQPASMGDVFRYCVRATGGPLTVALAWHDAPGSPSAGRALVNDLDLTVRAAGLGGLPLPGNGGGGAGAPPGSPDRTNNVETVAVAYLPPGDVAIEVRASSVPRGPQPFSLAVLGSFSGVLASKHNPAAADVDATGRCDVVVASVRSGPTGVVATRSVSFDVGAPGGRGGSSGKDAQYECALSPASTTPSSASWKPCTSPARYDGLADGAYVFRVRAPGEAAAAAREFSVDATPPTLAWRGGDAAAPPKDSAPPPATLAFGASDASPVTFTCTLERVGEGGPPPTLRLWSVARGSGRAAARPTTLASPANCTSPASYAWLPPGAWRATVTAVDAAGNAAVAPLTAEWKVAAPRSRSAFLVGGPYGPGNASSVSFDVKAVTPDGKVASLTPRDGVQCQLVPLSGGAGGAPVAGVQPTRAQAAADQPWTACGGSSPGKAVYDKLTDGAYQFSARLVEAGGSGGRAAVAGRRLSADDSAADDGSLAFTTFTVDTAPPTVTLDTVPPPVQANGSVAIAWSSGGEGAAAFTCTLASTANKTAPTPFSCTSPLTLTSLPDANYTLTVVGVDAVGNAAPPQTVRWGVDSVAPTVAAPSVSPPATKTGAATFSFAASDTGSGVVRTRCRLRLVAAPSGRKAAGRRSVLADGGGGGDASPPAPATRSPPSSDWADCASPYPVSDLADGRWGFAVRATDGAGNTGESAETSLWVARAPPGRATVTAAPKSEGAVPSRVTLAFATPADPGAAPVSKWECALVTVSGKEGAGAPAPAPSSPAPSPPPTWEACTSPRVYRGLASGGYTFRARPTDAAGNVGAPTPPSTFTVDAGLPLPYDPSDEGGGGFGVGPLTGWRLWAAVGGGAAALALLAVVAASLCKPAPPRLPPGGGGGQAYGGGGGGGVPQQHDPAATAEAAALRAALAASAAEAEAARARARQAATAAESREQADMRAAVAASIEEERVREAIARSLAER